MNGGGVDWGSGWNGGGFGLVGGIEILNERWRGREGEEGRKRDIVLII